MKKSAKRKSTKSQPLTLKRLRKVNLKRCEAVFHPLDSWTPSDWATALAGEVGELCNFIKKMRRGEKIPLEELAKECGDVQCYLDLTAARLGIDLEKATISKFNEVSDRRKTKIKL